MDSSFARFTVRRKSGLLGVTQADIGPSSRVRGENADKPSSCLVHSSPDHHLPFSSFYMPYDTIIIGAYIWPPFSPCSCMQLTDL